MPGARSYSDVSVAREALLRKQFTIFVSERTTHQIVILDSQGKQIGAISRNAADTISTDSDGNVYAVPEYGNRLDIYKPPYKAAPTVLRFGTQSVVFAAVDQKTGVYAVVTLYNGGGPGPPVIYFFRHESVKPCNVLGQQPGIATYGAYGAFDGEGTLFLVAGTNSGKTTVASIAGECSATTAVADSFVEPIDPYALVTVNADDDIVIQDFSVKSWPVYTYKHPVKGVFSKPVSTTVLAPSNGSAPQALLLGVDGRSIWGAFFETFAPLSLYRYPAGGVPIQSIHGLRYIWSVATFPALVPK